MKHLFSKLLSLALTGALVFQSAGPAFSAAPAKPDAGPAFIEKVFPGMEGTLFRVINGGKDVKYSQQLLADLAKAKKAYETGTAKEKDPAVVEFAKKYRAVIRAEAAAYAEGRLPAAKRTKLEQDFVLALQSEKKYAGLETMPGTNPPSSFQNAEARKRWDRFFQGSLGAYAKLGDDAPAEAAFLAAWKSAWATPAADALAKAFPDEKERAMVRCFSGAAAFEGALDTAKLRADALLGVQKRLLAPAQGTLSQECSKLTADELKAYYCANEPKAEGTPSADLQKLSAQCSDKRFEAAFPDPMARAVLQCLDPSKASFLGSEAKVKESFATAVTAARLALDKTAKDKLNFAFKDKKDEERAMKCVQGADKNDALLDFYCANAPKGAEIGPKTQLEAKCEERRAAKLFADPADHAVYQCLGPKTLPADLQKDPAKKDAVLKAWGADAAAKAQMVLTGSVDSAKLSKQEKDCLLGKGLGKDKLRDFYCRYQPADAEQRQTATGALDQGQLAENLSQEPGESVEFDNSGRKKGTLVAAGAKPSPLQELNQYCSDKRKQEEQRRTIPGRGLTINEPGAGSKDRDMAKEADDAKNKELMTNLKKDAIAGAYGAVGFGLLGLVLGGPAGALIGAMIGFAAMAAVTHLNNNPPK